MTSQQRQPAALERLLGKAVHLEPRETAPLLWSSLFFFCVLAGYYVIRPVREEMGVKVGRDALQALFAIVFLVMVAAVPLFGWVVSRFERRRIAPIVYAFFILNLIGFWLVLTAGAAGVIAAGGFFVWVSVFNLFVVSLFWSVMSDTYASAQAKRLYGFIAAGGSAGALAGPLITQSLVHWLGPNNLLLVSAAFMCGAVICVCGLRRATTATRPGRGDGEALAKGGLLAGAVHVWRSPYLIRIAAWVLLANLIGTYFYLEQARIVGATYAEPASRVHLFARMDLAVSVLTILSQLFLTGRIMERLGISVAAVALPAVAMAGLVGLAVTPTVGVVVGVMIAERAVAFAFSNPALRVLFTVVAPEDKYKAQNFIDTVVYRGGDAASGWVFGALAKALGAGASSVALLALPAAAVWAVISLGLGRRHAALAESPGHPSR